MLRTALGPAIARYLDDASIVEVILNPDGRLWIDRLSEGLSSRNRPSLVELSREKPHPRHRV
jgi:Flp pilus assembly CpaF family ATPase